MGSNPEISFFSFFLAGNKEMVDVEYLDGSIEHDHTISGNILPTEAKKVMRRMRRPSAELFVTGCRRLSMCYVWIYPFHKLAPAKKQVLPHHLLYP